MYFVINMQVVEPSVAVNHLHQELEMYKQVSEGFNESIKEYAGRIQRYEKIIQVRNEDNVGTTP
jgi:hypothetical protein